MPAPDNGPPYVIQTLARISVTIAGETKTWGWADARKRKWEVAAWLRAQIPHHSGPVAISWHLKQRSPQIDWRDASTFAWTGAADPGLGYAADDLVGTVEWGRGR